MIDKPQFQEILESVFEIYGKTCSETQLSLYYECLKHYTMLQIKTSLQACLVDTESGMFLPKPADIIRHIDGNIESQAIWQWHSLIKCIEQNIEWNDSDVADEAGKSAAKRIGGFAKLKTLTYNELEQIKPSFISVYRDCRATETVNNLALDGSMKQLESDHE